MTKSTSIWAGGAGTLALMVLTIVVAPASVDQTDAITLGHARTLTHQAGIPSLPGMAYATETIAIDPNPSTLPPDINQLLKDFPTAAGVIHEQALAHQQYLAATEGNYEQAMRLMAKSFLTTEGSGSYTTRW